jgi:hypothetical protein
MEFTLSTEEVKEALFNHLRKNMTVEEEFQYLEGKAEISVIFHHIDTAKLKLVIKEKETE